MNSFLQKLQPEQADPPAKVDDQRAFDPRKQHATPASSQGTVIKI